MPASALRLKCVAYFSDGGDDTGRQAELGVVGNRQRFLVILHPDHRRHRPEDLLAGDAHLVVHLGEQRRLQEEARGCRGCTSSPPTTSLAPSFLPISI